MAYGLLVFYAWGHALEAADKMSLEETSCGARLPPKRKESHGRNRKSGLPYGYKIFIDTKVRKVPLPPTDRGTFFSVPILWTA